MGADRRLGGCSNMDGGQIENHYSAGIHYRSVSSRNKSAFLDQLTHAGEFMGTHDGLAV